MDGIERPPGRRARALGVVEPMLAVLLFAVAGVEVASQSSPPLPIAVAVLLAAAVTLPVGASRRAPEAAAAVLLAGTVLQGLAPRSPSSIAELIALAIGIGQATVRVRRLRLPLCLLGVLAAVLVVLHSADPADVVAADYAFTGGVLAVPFGIGLVVRLRSRAVATARERTRTAVARRDELAQLAVQEERARVARELHDVVAHALSVVVVQAVGGRAVLGRDPDAAKGAFDTIGATGARALDEMRALLGALRAADETDRRPPGLDALPELARLATEAGLRVSVSTTGRPRQLPPSVELSAYRIVQEALTNAVRHATGAAATVEVRHGDHLLLRVVNGRGGGDGPLLPGSGNGILGMRERAILAGGTLSAGPTVDGGFVVEALLPSGPR